MLQLLDQARRRDGLGQHGVRLAGGALVGTRKPDPTQRDGWLHLPLDKASVASILMWNYRATKSSIFLRAAGGSMEPMIRDGSILQVECCRVRDLRIGDVVVFREHDRLSAHRCFLRARDFFYERGDNCGMWTRCPKRTEADLVGRVIVVRPPDGPPEDIGWPPYRRYGRLLCLIAVVSAVVGLIRGNLLTVAHQPLKGPFRTIVQLAFRHWVSPLRSVHRQVQDTR